MKDLKSRAAFEFLFIATVLCGIGYAIHCQINSQLNEALEESVLRHIRTVSYSIENVLNREIRGMHAGTELLEQNQIPLKTLNEFAAAFGKSSHSSGILHANGTAITEQGIKFPRDKLGLIKDAFHGEDVIVYGGEDGLIIATPIYINGELCASYQQYSNRNISELFGVISYDGLGRINLANKTGDWIQVTKSKNDELYNELYNAQGFEDHFTKAIIEKLATQSRTVSQYEYNGQNFIVFGAKIYNDELFLFGVVTREAVAVGIDFIHVVMLGGMILMCLFLFMFARSSIKSAENKELRVEKSAALQASKTKSEFLSNMSHEIRTPINAILGMNEMILRECKDENILEYAGNVRNAGNNLLGIVNDILDFSKIEAGKMEIIPVEYALSSLLNDLVNMIQKRAKDKGLEFIINADKNLPTILLGDEIRIKQVVTNILTNAVKYTEKGSVTLTVETATKSDEKIIIRFSVKDTGIGIKPEDISKLFSAFERIEEKRNRTIEGTGLGMNITQRLLDLMGTSLQVSSVYGEGSEFSFEIEQKIINAEPIGDFEEAFRNSLKQHKEYHEKFTAPSAKILIVDDTVMNLTVAKGLLKQTKIQIDTAESGYDCLELVQKNIYDVIFLDHRMPGMDGIETLQEMKKLSGNLNKQTPVISLTANAISGAREQYIAAGFQDYLTKPINSVQLENMLMKYLPPEKVKVARESEDALEENIPEEKINLPDFLDDVDGLDTKEGVKHCGGGEEYLDALKIFAQSILSNADEIEKFFRAEDWKSYTTKVHALKSSARVIGAAELSEKARRLEDAGNSGYFDEIQHDTEPLLELYRSYAEKLSPLIQTEEDDSDKPLIDEDALLEAYEAMKEAAAAFDYDSIEFVFQSLDEYRLPEDEAARYKKIKDAATNLDWEKINELLN